MPANDVIKVARGELSVTENPPGSNRVKYWQEYDPAWQGQPWCVCGLWWCFQHAGEGQAFFGGAKTASCGTLFRWYQAQELTVPVYDVQPMDLVFMNFHGGTLPEHVGLAESVTSTPLQVTTIEFNTSPGLEGSQDNGGCVARKIRYRTQIVGVARPKYKEEEMPKTDYSDRWSAAAIRRCIERGIMSGYPDGSFKPTQMITREEAATVADNIVEYIREVIKNG